MCGCLARRRSAIAAPERAVLYATASAFRAVAAYRPAFDAGGCEHPQGCKARRVTCHWGCGVPVGVPGSVPYDATLWRECSPRASYGRLHACILPARSVPGLPASLGGIGVSYDWPVALMSLSGLRSLTIIKSAGGTA